MLGLSFDDNGKYIGWSTLFDYSSQESLSVSEYLPAPQKTVYNKVDTGYDLNNYLQILKESNKIIRNARRILDGDPNNEEAQNQLNTAQQTLEQSGLDLNPYITEILQANNIIDSLRGYIKILTAINTIARDKRANIYYTVENAQEVIQKLREHEFTKLPTQLLSDANKNFIASHIQNVIQDLENMIAAYQPVEMEDLRDASNLSPKGQQQSQMTLLNPTTKLFMQYANITGKNVVGIAANGIKGSFMWYYYINDILHNPAVIDIDQKLNYARFEFTTNRLIGRSTGNLEQVTLNTLSDINTVGVDPEILARLGNRYTSKIPVDNTNSQLVSASTDNAKELILAKINSGNKLAKMYSFLISLGIDVKDIVSFMTSDVASFIDTVTETDIFNDYDVKIEDAIQIARTGQVPRKYNKHKDKILAIYNEYGLNNTENRETINADINEFQNILEGANEFSNLARFLGLNQGIPTSKVEIQNILSFIQSIFNNRLTEYKNSHPLEKWTEDILPLDVYRWMHDAAYREEISEVYNRFKKCINVFDIFNSIPQFDAIREIFAAILDTDPVISIKSKAYDRLYDAAKKRSLFMTEEYQNRLLSSIDNDLITNFILSKHIKVPIKKGITYLNQLSSTTKSKTDNLFEIRTKDDIATFKYIFENTIIPLLKEGKAWKYENGEIKEEVDIRIKSNPFIQGLRIIRKNNQPLYTVDLNMLTIENSTDSQQKFQRYSTGLQRLASINFGGRSISNWFILYNLVVNKNGYGANRLTTLFDTFLKSGTSIDLLNEYFQYISKLDYESNVSLDIDAEEGDFVIGFEDSLISAAKIVSSTVGQRDPYIIVNRGEGPLLMKRDKGQYVPMGFILDKLKGESINDYLDRVNNFNSYNTLGINFSNQLNRQINEIITLGDNAVARLNDFVTKGILLIQKICQ